MNLLDISPAYRIYIFIHLHGCPCLEITHRLIHFVCVARIATIVFNLRPAVQDVLLGSFNRSCCSLLSGCQLSDFLMRRERARKVAAISGVASCKQQPLVTRFGNNNKPDRGKDKERSGIIELLALSLHLHLHPNSGSSKSVPATLQSVMR